MNRTFPQYLYVYYHIYNLYSNIQNKLKKNVMPRLHGSGRNSMSSHKVTGYNLGHIIPLNSFCILKL